LDPLRKLNEAAAREADQSETTAEVVERESRRLDVEEQRILDAYRAGLLSPAQLAGQLEKVKAERAALDLERTRMQSAVATSPEQTERSVVEYCAEAAKNLA